MIYRILASLLFLGAAGIFGGFCLAMVYEAYAIASGRVATISAITHSAVVNHPVWGPVLLFLAGIIVGGLCVHFVGWKAES